jgi:hypothetical protein
MLDLHHLPSALNLFADGLSRRRRVVNYFPSLTGVPDHSWVGDSEHDLKMDWSQVELLRPPLEMLPLVPQKVRRDRFQGLVLIPCWEIQNWYHQLRQMSLLSWDILLHHTLGVDVPVSPGQPMLYKYRRLSCILATRRCRRVAGDFLNSNARPALFGPRLIRTEVWSRDGILLQTAYRHSYPVDKYGLCGTRLIYNSFFETNRSMVVRRRRTQTMSRQFLSGGHRRMFCARDV